MRRMQKACPRAALGATHYIGDPLFLAQRFRDVASGTIVDANNGIATGRYC
jgi:hypothetical protein